MDTSLFTRQRNGYYCGPAVMQGILRLWGIRYTQARLARLAMTTKARGTMPQDMVRVLVGLGLKVSSGENQTPAKLRAAIRAGKQVIACVTEKWGEGHYVIVVAVGATTIQVFDPNNRRRMVSYKLTDFLKRWQDPLLTKTRRFAAYIG